MLFKRISQKRFFASAALLCVVTTSSAGSPSVSWPEEWRGVEGGFGRLQIEYRLTNECGIDPDFNIAERPSIEVTRNQVFDVLKGLLMKTTVDVIPKDAYRSANLAVLGQEESPDRALEESEYKALLASLKASGPWPQVRTVPIYSEKYKCMFDKMGRLLAVEQLDADEKGYIILEGDLSQLGPFSLGWSEENN